MMSPGAFESGASLERFQAKWIPVRVKKTRQNKKMELHDPQKVGAGVPNRS
jgi:hypothetical protein